MSLVPARNGANRPPNPAIDNLALDLPKTSTKGKLPTGYAEEIILSEHSFRNLHRGVERQQATGKKRKRETKGDSGIVYGAGAYKGPWAKYKEERPDSDSGEEIEVEVSGDESGEDEVIYEEDAIAPVPARGTLVGTSYEEISADKENSVFEGSLQYDYQGRTYMHVPQDLDVDLTSDFENLSLKCYQPKKLVHTYRGSKKPSAHEKSITQTKFFPSSGHLLLTSSADSKVKLWDVYHNRELLRSYAGHTKSVADIDFSPDGTHFLTASYDRQMKIWNTETGTCIGRFSTGATPHVIRWHPEHLSGADFIAGMHDNKIVQFDSRAPSDANNDDSTSTTDRKKPVQTYDHHLGPVNTLTWTNENRQFVSTSDDKSLRAWDYTIPVPVKLIAEPHLFPLTTSIPHPTKPSILFQSADNTIQVYNTSAEKTLRQNRKKEFRGHNTAGYKISLDVSPDGGIVCSGDGAGWVCFWDWKTGKLWHKIQAGGRLDQKGHGGGGGSSGAAVIATAWHPRESSKVVTGDVEGNLRYWD